MNPHSDNEEEQSSPTGECGGIDPRGDVESTLRELLLCAEAYDRGAGASSDAEEWFRAESESLLQWAEITGRKWLPRELLNALQGFKELESGLEHRVFYHQRAGRVYKITKAPHFGHTWYLKDYVQNVIWCNQLFRDDMRLEGVMSGPDGASRVMSQRFIRGSSPSMEEILAWFDMQNCVNIHTNKFQYPDGTIVADAHEGNIIKDSSNALFPIDLHIEKWGGHVVTPMSP